MVRFALICLLVATVTTLLVEQRSFACQGIPPCSRAMYGMFTDLHRCSVRNANEQNEQRQQQYAARCQSMYPASPVSPHDPPGAREERIRECRDRFSNQAGVTCDCCEQARLANFQPIPPGTGVVTPAPINGPPVKEPPSQTVQEPNRQDPPSEQHDCKSNEACQRAAAEAQRRAAEEARLRREAYQREAREARELRQSSITSAATVLDNWKRALDNNPRATQEEHARFQNDRRIYMMAHNAETGGPSGPLLRESDLARVSDPGVRADLSAHIDSRNTEQALQSESKRLGSEEQKLQDLSRRNLDRAAHLGSVRPGSKAPLAAMNPSSDSLVKAAAPRSDAVNKSTLSTSGASGASEARAVQKLVGGDSNVKSSSAALDDGPGGGAVSALLKTGGAGSLRDILRRKLHSSATEGKDAKDGKGGGQQGNGAVDSAAGNFAQSNSEGGSGAVAGLGMQTGQLGQEKGREMGIKSEETANDVRQLVADAGIDREPASVSGLLGMDTASLFERIRQAHRSCQARDCISHAR